MPSITALGHSLYGYFRGSLVATTPFTLAKKPYLSTEGDAIWALDTEEIEEFTIDFRFLASLGAGIKYRLDTSLDATTWVTGVVYSLPASVVVNNYHTATILPPVGGFKNYIRLALSAVDATNPCGSFEFYLNSKKYVLEF